MYTENKIALRKDFNAFPKRYAEADWIGTFQQVIKFLHFKVWFCQLIHDSGRT